MCGICGVASHDPRAVPLRDDTLRAMTDAMKHRGPDDEGRHIEPGVALGARRLSIIDVPGSSQPRGNEDGSVRTVFNGEIYNFRELRGELEAKGHRFATDGDTETIVHLYEEHGPEFPKRLRGMFAIALWDRARRRLLLSRDRMGVKPLYFVMGLFGLAFASEVGALLAGGLVQAELDPLAAELFLAFGFVPGPATLFAGVRKLMPASTLVWENGALRHQGEYWTPWDDWPDGIGESWDEDQDRLLAALRRSVRERMVSDVPLGVMLSGGLDSSLITALMAETSSRAVETFSVGFAKEAGANELADARHVATRLGTNHHELTTSGLDHPGLLENALRHLEEPIADISFIGFHQISELAHGHVTVALSGQGADELLGGYRKHQVAAAADQLRRVPGELRSLLRLAATAGGATSTFARGVTALTTDDPAERMLAMSRVLQAHDRPRLLSREFIQHDAETAIRNAIRDRVSPQAESILSQTLDVDAKLALVDSMLLYFDKMSMANSLEVRVPFMDHDMVSLCWALADSRKVHRLRRKELLKRASDGLVDDKIINKPKRAFFRTALRPWMQAHGHSLVRDTLLDRHALERGLYQEQAVRRLVGGVDGAGFKASQQLFSLLALELWQRVHIDRDVPKLSSPATLGKRRQRPRLLLISAVRNESDHIERVARAVAAQSRPPDTWLVVDDESGDSTAEILRSLQPTVPFMRLLTAPQRPEASADGDRLAVAAEAQAFNWALESIPWREYTHVAKLDGDVELPQHYFDYLLAAFDRDPQLGLAGGGLVECTNGRWKTVPIPTSHIHGAVKLYSRQCFEAVGGIQERLGWDTIDETYARMRGFGARSFPELEARHHRHSASASGRLKGRARHGQCAYIVRQSPLWVFLRGFKVAATARPFGLSAVAFVYGYFSSMARALPKVEDDEFRRFIRREERHRLLSPQWLVRSASRR